MDSVLVLWMSEKVRECMSEWESVWVSERVCKWMSEWMIGWVSECVCVCMFIHENPIFTLFEDECKYY